MNVSDSDRSFGDDDDLPVLDWEDATCRIRIPDDLRKALGLPVSILRWSKAKRAQVLQAHARDAEVIANVERYLQQWEMAGPDDTRAGNWNVLFFANGRIHVFTFGLDASGSHNVVTVFGTTRQPYIMRKMRQKGMQRRIRK